VDFAILADHATVAADQDRGVEMPAVGREFGIAKLERDAVLTGTGEQRSQMRFEVVAGQFGLRRRSFAPEEGVDLGRVCHEPAWKEGRERKLRKHHEVAFLRRSL